jgi:hypothetical protein
MNAHMTSDWPESFDRWSIPSSAEIKIAMDGLARPLRGVGAQGSLAVKTLSGEQRAFEKINGGQAAKWTIPPSDIDLRLKQGGVGNIMPKADWSCDDCGEVLSADRFQKITDRELAHTGTSTRFYKGTRGGLGVGGSSSTSYRHVTKRICPDCVQERLEAARRARARRFWTIVIWVAIISAVIFYIASLPPSADAPRTAQTPSESVQNTVANEETALPVSSNEAQTEDLSAEAPATSMDVEGISPPPANFYERADNAEPATSTPVLGDDSREMEAAIYDATLRALDTGEPADWSTGRRQGQVIVSAERTDRNKICRSAHWVLITASNQITGPSKLWCRNDGSAWRRFDP